MDRSHGDVVWANDQDRTIGQWNSNMVSQWLTTRPHEVGADHGSYGQFEPQALLCTDTSTSASQMVAWFVLRWQLEITFEEARAHLGIETQRQWSELAILRTTPGLLGLFSLVTLFAHQVLQGQEVPTRQAAWYHKDVPTFADTIAFVRQQLWPVEGFWMSGAEQDIVKIPRALLERFTEALAYAA